ncbi:MAG: LacI family DNA-binding transcriptional regulator [Treponema sp.]|jgi:LacI family transcriptional regulator|nr:LacI family DNA-binding transcriptional regulator [Treponema sp.]
MVTSKQVAKMAGVSRGTVDRVINNRGMVKESTRQRIQEIIRRLNYKPSRAGKVLVSHQKKLKIGCIIIKAQNPFYDDLYRGITLKVEEYSSYGIEVIVERVDFCGESQLRSIKTLLNRGINALVIQPMNDPAVAEKLAALARRGLPIVTTNTDIEDFDSLCYVGNDFFTCGKTAANLLDLITGGKCAIGVVTGFGKARSHSDRVAGFREYIAGRPEMRVLAVKENFDDDTKSFTVTRRLIAAHPEMDALFLVAGGVRGAGKALKSFPDRRIRTICFDDVPTTKELIRDGTILAAICQQPVRQGSLSLEVLFEYLIDGKTPVKKKLYTDIQIKLKSNLDL